MGKHSSMATEWNWVQLRLKNHLQDSDPTTIYTSRTMFDCGERKTRNNTTGRFNALRAFRHFHPRHRSRARVYPCHVDILRGTRPGSRRSGNEERTFFFFLHCAIICAGNGQMFYAPNSPRYLAATLHPPG